MAPESGHRTVSYSIPPLVPYRSKWLRDSRAFTLARECRHSATVIAAALALWTSPAVAQTVDANLWVPNGPVFAVVSQGNTIYIGGRFTSVGPASGGAGVERRNIAALDATTGAATSWNPRVEGGFHEVYALAVSGNTVYVGGSFASIGAQPRTHLAAVDAVSGLATDWNPDIGGDSYEPIVVALAVSDNTIYVGGFFAYIGGETRIHLGAIDAVTGAPTPWAPSVRGIVYSLALSGSTVYVGEGESAEQGPGPRPVLRPGHVVAIDAVSGVTDWSVVAGGLDGGGVQALAISGNTIYAGGTFAPMGGQADTAIAAIDRATGSVADWNPNITGPGGASVSAVATGGKVVYVSGFFTSAGGQARQLLAALDARTANALPWDPNPDGGVWTLWLSGNTVYAGGFFTNICGQHHPYLAAITTAGGSGPISSQGVVQGRLSIRETAKGRAHLTFAVPVGGPVEIAAFDVSGRRVATITREVLPSGVYQRDWNMGAIAKGLYFVRMQSGGTHVTTKVLKLH